MRERPWRAVQHDLLGTVRRVLLDAFYGLVALGLAFEAGRRQYVLRSLKLFQPSVCTVLVDGERQPTSYDEPI